MPKFALSLLTFVLCINIALAQKTFIVTVKFDTAVVSKNVRFSYNNGKRLIEMPDTVDNNGRAVLTGKYYSQLAHFSIYYTESNRKYYGNDFFLTDKPATINVTYNSNINEPLPHTYIKNAIPIFDTTENKSWARMSAFMNVPEMTKAYQAFDDFMKRNGRGLKKDSIPRMQALYKPYLNRAILYFKQQPDDYFSFWHFAHQIAQVNSILSTDTAYLRQQFSFYKSVFPAKYTNSIEGKRLTEDFEIKLNPLQLNTAAPLFNVTGVDGKKISLAGLKGKYVLLDFWATWCPPCMAEMPFIKEIRKKYPPEKLAIIGISADKNLSILKATAKKEGMNWLHYYDEDNSIRRKYGVDAIPILVLIDKDGKMVYRSDFKTADAEALPKILAGME